MSPTCPRGTTPLGPLFDASAAACPLCGGAILPWATKSHAGHPYRYDRCQSCDFAFVNPRPTQQWLDGYYSASGIDVEPPAAPPLASAADVPDPGPWPTRVIADMVAAGRAGGRMLDVGAGNGWITAAAVRAGLSITALELSPACLADLRRLPNVTPIPVGFERFDAPPGSFDFVFMSHVLEHAHDPRAWVERAANLLTAGGVLSVALPHFNSIYRLLGGTVDPYFFPPEHLNHFNRRSLGRLAEACGLTPVRWETLGDFPTDVITKRVRLPRPVAAAVRAATACVGFAVECTTRLTGTGPVLSMLAVKRCYALKAAGFETVMVNCNPETVSTDYDTADRLYFEPLTAEDVLEVLHKEMENGELVGVIVQFGGQTPLNLAQALKSVGIPILGTSPDNIDLAEDREAFAALIGRLGLRQPDNGIATGREQAAEIAARVGYPVLMRPSFVLGGRAMEVVETPAALDAYLRDNAAALSGGPVLIDQYLRDAVEVDVDALADADTVFVAGVLQHIEEAGVHSGDSSCSIPPHSLSADIVADIERQTALLARALAVRGLMNIQFAVKDDKVYLIEVNPRASRTVPFTAKATGIPARQDRRAGHGRREPRVVRPQTSRLAACRGQGGGFPLRPLPRHRPRPRP